MRVYFPDATAVEMGTRTEHSEFAALVRVRAMLKLDIDNYQHQPPLKMLRLFYSLPLPFFVRVSSSGKGLHVKAPDLEMWSFLRYIFDDPMRISLDEKRIKIGLPVSNLLWDIKEGKKSGVWIYIQTQQEIRILFEGLLAESISTQERIEYCRHLKRCDRRNRK